MPPLPLEYRGIGKKNKLELELKLELKLKLTVISTEKRFLWSVSRTS